MDYNYHTHTDRCGHALGEDEQYVKAAIEAGFKVLGFSDHVPFKEVHHPSERMDYAQMEGYLESINALKAKYADKIEIKVGFELEYFPEFKDYYQSLLKHCDYLICGQHNKTLDAYSYDLYADDEDVIIYANQVKAAMESGLVSFIAHPDYFMLGRNRWSDACAQAARIIAEAAERNNVPLEINLNGLRYGKKLYGDLEVYPYPFPSFWQEVAQYNVKCIYSFDAHRPTTLLEKERIALVLDQLNGIHLNIEEQFRI